LILTRRLGMKRPANLWTLAVLSLFLITMPALAQMRKRSGQGRVVTPQSSIAQLGDSGRRMHTNIKVFMPDGARPLIGPPFPGFGFETPASLACVYGLAPQTRGCNPNRAIANPTGGKGAIAIVDAFHDPHALADLKFFSKQFGLPAPNLTIVFATGTKPAKDPTGGWELEESLDIEWAHAMAPEAKIFLVEAASNSLEDLLTAEIVASNLVASAGGGEVSNSWSGPEFPEETQVDPFFTMPGVVFFASSGDEPGVSYPSSSPNVVGAGGTTTARDENTGDFLYEIPWDLAGGGISEFESRPDYQNRITRVVGKMRGTPDISFDSNPVTGVWVWDSNDFEGGPGGWFVLGGTSVASPALAGVVNSAEHLYHSTDAELSVVYNHLGDFHDFRDILFGFCGPYSGSLALPGWDVCTGVGSAIGKHGK
jgi:kumamolisin